MVVVGEELFLKITMCDTNEKFEAILDKYLVDIINDIIVRQEKALEIISHIRSRVKSLETVQLPVAPLFDLFESTSSPPVKMFSSMFLKIGIARMQSLEELENVIIRCLLQKDLPFMSQWSLNFHRILNTTGKEESCKIIQKHVSKLRGKFSDEDWPTFLTRFATFIKFILVSDLSPLCILSPKEKMEIAQSRLNPITRKDEITSDQKIKEKSTICHFIIHWTYISGSEQLPAEFSLPLLKIIDFLHPKGNSESALRCLNYSIEDQKMVNILYQLFLGELNPVSDKTQIHAKAPDRLKISIAKMLLRSSSAAKTFPASLQVTFELLRDDLKSQARGVAYDWLHHLKAESAINPKIVPILLERIYKILAAEDSTDDDRLLNLIPYLIELNAAAFSSKILDLVDILLKGLHRTPSVTAPILALCKIGSADPHRERLLMKINGQSPPAGNKWFLNCLLEAVAILVPFDPYVGPHRLFLLDTICDVKVPAESRELAAKLLGIVKFEPIIAFLSTRDSIVPSLELLSLMKKSILAGSEGPSLMPSVIEKDNWKGVFIESLKAYEEGMIVSLQKILLNFSQIGNTLTSSEQILSQLELLECTVRAKRPLESSEFIVKTVNTFRPEKICQFLQGHSFAINMAASSLLATQMKKTDFATYAPLFEFDEKVDGARKSAFQMALAVYCGRMQDDESMLRSIELIQSMMDNPWTSHSGVVLERLLTCLGYVSSRVQIEKSLVEQTGKCLSHEHEKVKIAAIRALAHFSGSPFMQDDDTVELLLDTLLSLENVDSARAQLAVSVTVVSLATGAPPSDGFDIESADLRVRPRIVEAILDRTFHKAKGKQKGTGIWLAALCDAGKTSELSEELNKQLFCGLLNRLLLSSEESTYCAKGLRKFHAVSSEEQRRTFSNILNLVIAHGKVPEKDGKLAERKIPLEDAMGLKDLLKIILELKINDHVFDLLSLGLTGDLTAVKNIDEKSIKLLAPDLLLMVNHKNDSIRSIGKNIFQAFEVSKRIDSLLKNCLDKCLERIQGFDGDYREAANRTLPVLLQHLSADVNVLPPERFIDLWNCVLRCCDDTRDNVKAVATTSCLELMKFTIRVVNEASVIPNWIKPMLDIIVDEYLDSATTTNVVIGMSLVSRWAESKRGLPLLFPYATKLIPILIQKCAVSEQVNISKGATRSQNYAEVEQETLEKTKHSEFLRVGYKIVDNDNFPVVDLKEICNRVGTIIRTGVGVNARGVALNFGARLCLKWKTALSDGVGKLLAPTLALLASDSNALRIEAASSVPFMIGAASDKTKSNFCSRVEKNYFEYAEAGTESSLGSAIASSVKKLSEDQRPQMAALCWLGRFDKAQGTSFENGWDNGEYQVRPYAEEIFDLASKAARSPSWNFRAQGIEALCAATESRQVVPRRLIKSVHFALDQRFFNGKEKLLEAVGLLSQLAEDDPTFVDYVNLLIGESKSGNASYKEKCLTALADISESMSSDRRILVLEVYIDVLRNTRAVGNWEKLRDIVVSWMEVEENVQEELKNM